MGRPDRIYIDIGIEGNIINKVRVGEETAYVGDATGRTRITLACQEGNDLVEAFELPRSALPAWDPLSIQERAP